MLHLATYKVFSEILCLPDKKNCSERDQAFPRSQGEGTNPVKGLEPKLETRIF